MMENKVWNRSVCTVQGRQSKVYRRAPIRYAQVCSRVYVRSTVRHVNICDIMYVCPLAWSCAMNMCALGGADAVPAHMIPGAILSHRQHLCPPPR